eukprot:CAMPEP_0182477004 /NCGR_PEP_ID=MMETSP1319-20130603/30188_1 /TAXON_ID=172717 /ORGANISM="Bolidomonas pacifica, Strain RCC208" /LENGTH=305 /DNA_ID=CAMNT_0024678165 /DNA_START=262 /DNA_END=1176 /DNA_ORIENTATION=+
MAAFPMPSNVTNVLIIPSPAPKTIIINTLPLNTSALSLIINLPNKAIISIDGEVTTVDYTSSPHPCMSLSTTAVHNTLITTVVPASPSSASHQSSLSSSLRSPSRVLSYPSLPTSSTLVSRRFPSLPSSLFPSPANHLSPSSAALPFSYPVLTSLRGSRSDAPTLDFLRSVPDLSSLASSSSDLPRDLSLLYLSSRRPPSSRPAAPASGAPPPPAPPADPLASLLYLYALCLHSVEGALRPFLRLLAIVCASKDEAYADAVEEYVDEADLSQVGVEAARWMGAYCRSMAEGAEGEGQRRRWERFE